MTGCIFCHSLAKNFQQDQSNIRRFPVFPGGISNSWRIPVFPGVVDNQQLVDK